MTEPRPPPGKPAAARRPKSSRARARAARPESHPAPPKCPGKQRPHHEAAPGETGTRPIARHTRHRRPRQSSSPRRRLPQHRKRNGAAKASLPSGRRAGAPVDSAGFRRFRADGSLLLLPNSSTARGCRSDAGARPLLAGLREFLVRHPPFVSVARHSAFAPGGGATLMSLWPLRRED